MNNFMVVKVNPFDMVQKATIFNNGEQEIIPVPMKDFVNTMSALINDYEITRVDMSGNPDFLNRYKAEILNSQYSNSDVEINIL